MRKVFRLALFIAVVFTVFLIIPITVQAEPFKFSSSTQFLWGDDLLGDNQSILSQYLRFSFNPEGKPISITGYGRVWKDFGDSSIRDNDFSGRLYYLFIDYTPIENVSFRLGRQFMTFTAGASIMDGLRVDVHDIGPVGITAAGGRDVIFSLDSESSKLGNYFVGIDLHLEKIKSTQLGISYVRKYDEWDLAREEFGANFRYIHKYISPYAEVKYDNLSRAVDEATIGLDIFPMGNLLIKGEFYYAFPTFDSTSIFSVFGVDKYRDYLVSAEYSLPDSPVTLFASYTRQTYNDSDNSDLFKIGVKATLVEKLAINAAVDHRTGFGGKLYGFEVYGDYKLGKELRVSAGVQYDTYMRPDQTGNNYAQRYWLGGEWFASKNISIIARLEEDINETFNHRTLGRIALNWNL